MLSFCCEAGIMLSARNNKIIIVTAGKEFIITYWGDWKNLDNLKSSVIRTVGGTLTQTGGWKGQGRISGRYDIWVQFKSKISGLARHRGAKGVPDCLD